MLCTDTQSLKDAPLENSDAVAAADVVRNLGRVALVVHQQEI